MSSVWRGLRSDFKAYLLVSSRSSDRPVSGCGIASKLGARLLRGIVVGNPIREFRSTPEVEVLSSLFNLKLWYSSGIDKKESDNSIFLFNVSADEYHVMLAYKIIQTLVFG